MVLLSGTDGALMVDGGSAERSPELLQVVAERTGGKPVRVLFNTHWHPECTGSNLALAKAGAKIIAHENTKLWMGAEIDVQWQHKIYPPAPKEARPTATFYTTGQMTFDGQPVEYGYMLQAHTDSDIYVHFPQANILAVGDVVSAGAYPILDWSTGGWITGLWEGQKTLLGICNDQTKIIASSGPVLSKADLQAEYDMLTTVRDRLIKLLRQGKGPKEMIAAGPTQEFDAKWGNPDLFIQNAYKGLWGHVREIGGIV